MITLKPVEQADRTRLWNVFQKYYYEMSPYYDLRMDPSGCYEYRYFDSYFKENGRAAYFIYDGEAFIGFSMINDYSCLGDRIDHAVAEFTVFPRYRRGHRAEEAARSIFRLHPGRWEIKFSDRNLPAAAFWRKITEQYTPQETPLGGNETVLSFTTEA